MATTWRIEKQAKRDREGLEEMVDVYPVKYFPKGENDDGEEQFGRMGKTIYRIHLKDSRNSIHAIPEQMDTVTIYDDQMYGCFINGEEVDRKRHKKPVRKWLRRFSESADIGDVVKTKDGKTVEVRIVGKRRLAKYHFAQRQHFEEDKRTGRAKFWKSQILVDVEPDPAEPIEQFFPKLEKRIGAELVSRIREGIELADLQAEMDKERKREGTQKPKRATTIRGGQWMVGL